MVAEATRGVRFVLKAETDESVGENLNAIGQRAAQLQRMLGDFKLGGLDIGRFQTSVDRAHAKLDDLRSWAISPINVTPFPTSQIATPPTAMANKSLSSLADGEPPTGEQAEAGVGKPASKTSVTPLVDPAAVKTAVEHLVDDYLAAEKRMEAASTVGAAKRTAAHGRAAKIEADQEKALTAQAEAENEKRAALPERIIRIRIKTLLRVQKAEVSQEKAERAAADREIARLQKQADAEQRATDKQADTAAKAADRSIQQSAKVAQHDEESTKKRAAAHERATRKIEDLNKKLRASLSEAAGGVGELAQGFVEMGLVSEDDFNKIKEKILAVKSAMDQVHTAVEVWKSLSEAAKLYGERLKMVREAETAAAMAERLRKGVGVATTVGAAVEGTATVGGSAAAGAAGIAGLVAAINPVTVALAGLAAIVLGTMYALNRWDEELKEAAAKEKEERQKELDIREAQNGALLKIFQAEQHAREKTNAQERIAQRIDRNFGEGREEYEQRADKLGIKSGAARDQYIANQQAIDENESEVQRVKKELEEVRKYPERSRDAEKEVPFEQQSKAISAADRKRLEEIAKERAEIEGRMSQAEQEGRTNLHTRAFFGLPMQTDYGYDRERMVDLDREKAELEKKNKPAEGFNKFAADPQAEVAAKQQEEALQQQLLELQEKGAGLQRQNGRQTLEYLNEQLQKQQELLKQDDQRVQAAREYAAQTRKTFEDAMAAFGMLTEGQKRRAVELQGKLDKGEKLSRKELEDAQRFLGEKGKAQARRQAIDSLTPEQRELFHNEEHKDKEANENVEQAERSQDSRQTEFDDLKKRIDEFNRQAKGGEKGQIKMDAEGHWRVEINWDKGASAEIATAMKPAIANFGAAIEDMLKASKAQIKADLMKEIRRIIQPKAQKGAAGA